MNHILRIKKHEPSAVAAMERHDMRLNKTYKNENVDLSRSHLNEVFFYEGAFNEKIKNIWSAHGIEKVRKNHVPMCEVLISASKEFFDGWDKNSPLPPNKMQYFLDAFEFLKRRFGKNNVIAAVLHLDEENPHLHFQFTPVVYDNKKEKFKLAVRDLNFDKLGLMKLHTDFNNEVGKKYGLSRGGEIKRKYIPKIEDFKKNAATQAEIVELQKTLDAQLAQLQSQRNANESALAVYEKSLEKAKKVAKGFFKKSVSIADYAELQQAFYDFGMQMREKVEKLQAEVSVLQAENSAIKADKAKSDDEMSAKYARARRIEALCDELDWDSYTLENFIAERDHQRKMAELERQYQTPAQMPLERTESRYKGR